MEECLKALKKSFYQLALHYPYFKENGGCDELYKDVLEFFMNFSNYYNSYDRTRSITDILDSNRADIRYRHFVISVALIIMAYLQSKVNTCDERKKASARTSKLLWDEWGSEHFTHYTGAPLKFDEYGRLNIWENQLFEQLYSKVVDCHSTILQNMAGDLYRYLYKEVGSFKNSANRLSDIGLINCEFRFPLI